MSTQEVFFHVPLCFAFFSYSNLVPIVLWLYGQRMVTRSSPFDQLARGLISRVPHTVHALLEMNETKRMFVEKKVQNLTSSNRIRYKNDIFSYNGQFVFRFFYKL